MARVALCDVLCMCCRKNRWPSWGASAIGAMLDAGSRSVGISEGVSIEDWEKFITTGTQSEKEKLCQS